MLILIKSQQMITKVSNNIKRAKELITCRLIEIIGYINACQIQINAPSCTQNKNIDKETSKSKKMKKNT